MTLGTAPPTWTSDYKMVQLEHLTKLYHTRHTNALLLEKELAFGSYAPPDRLGTVVLVDRDDIFQGYEVNKAALINSYKVNYLIWQEER